MVVSFSNMYLSVFPRIHEYLFYFVSEIPVVQMMATEEDDDGYSEYPDESSSNGKSLY